MTTIKYDDYLEELKDEEFKAGYLIEKNILESAIALSNEEKRMSLDIHKLKTIYKFRVYIMTINQIIKTVKRN